MTHAQNMGNGFASLKADAKSPYFYDILERAEALQDGNTKVWKYRKRTNPHITEGTDAPFQEWIALAAARCRAGQSPKHVLLASGELYTLHWNDLLTARVPRILDNGEIDASDPENPTVIDFFRDECRVDGVCCYYVNKEKPSPDAAPEAAGINAMFDRVFWAAAKSDDPAVQERIRLYSSFYREECHWICVGDEMHVVDWHPPCDERTDERENTFIMRGPAVAKFARKEFEYTLRRLDFNWSLYVPPVEYWNWQNKAELPDEYNTVPSDGVPKNAVPYLQKDTVDMFQYKSAAEIGVIFKSNLDPRMRNPFAS